MILLLSDKEAQRYIFFGFGLRLMVNLQLWSNSGLTLLLLCSSSAPTLLCPGYINIMLFIKYVEKGG